MICNSVQHYATVCDSVQRYATIYNSVHHCATVCNNVQRCATLHKSMQQCTAICNGMQWYATACRSLQRFIVQQYATVFNDMHGMQQHATICNNMRVPDCRRALGWMRCNGIGCCLSASSSISIHLRLPLSVAGKGGAAVAPSWTSVMCSGLSRLPVGGAASPGKASAFSGASSLRSNSGDRVNALLHERGYSRLNINCGQRLLQ